MLICKTYLCIIREEKGFYSASVCEESPENCTNLHPIKKYPHTNSTRALYRTWALCSILVSTEWASLSQMPLIVLRALHIVHINCLCLFVLSLNSSSFPSRLVLITLLSILYFACILLLVFFKFYFLHPMQCQCNALSCDKFAFFSGLHCIAFSASSFEFKGARTAKCDSKPLNDDITIHVYWAPNDENQI